MDTDAELIQVKAHTALHLVKGAVRKVLGTKWTASVKQKGDKGILTVKSSRAPSEDEKKRIQELVDEKIRQDVAILVHQIDRVEAEKQWGDEIYDLFPLPQSITKLFVLEIPDWNLNCCREKHLKSTGEFGSVSITKFKFNENKELFEVTFTVT